MPASLLDCETPEGPVLLVLGAGPPSTQGEGLKLQLPQFQPHLQPSSSVTWDSGVTWLHSKVKGLSLKEGRYFQCLDFTLGLKFFGTHIEYELL